MEGFPSSNSSSSDWCTVESDPGVFTELLEKIGVSGVELQELWSLDDESLQLIQEESEIYGLIFLFQWNDKDHANSSTDTSANASSESEPLTTTTLAAEEDNKNNDNNKNLFFAHQVTTNACATQAILSVVLNRLPDEQLGDTLREFKSFTQDFPPQLKGLAISGSEEIKKAHNSFARADAFLEEGKVQSSKRDKEGEAFHFVAYIPFTTTSSSTVVYELDGLQSAPIVIGSTATTTTATTGNTNNNNQEGEHTTSIGSSSWWLATAREAIQARMDRDSQNTVKYNLMAVVQDKRIRLQEHLSILSSSTSTTQMSEDHDDEDNHNMDDDDDATTASVNELVSKLAAENAKREGWKLENQRRRHNYVPLIVELFKELARKNALESLLQEAQQKQRLKSAANNNKNQDQKMAST